MIELTPDNVVSYLVERGHLDAQTSAGAEALAWGVSNVVLRVTPERGEALVVKQSRRKLRTQADWFSRLDRIYREADAMQVLGDLLPPGVVPRILFEDRPNYLFAMEAVDADHVVWKAELLEGTADADVAILLGELLADVHRKTADDPQLYERWIDREVFDQLRIDPFYRRIAQVHRSIGPAVDRLITSTLQTTHCAVHADFSPKNVLITGELPHRRLHLVDFETAHYGDPAFDLGFFLSHLLLKTVKYAARADEYLQLVRSFWQRYSARLTDEAEPFSLSELERRTVPHLAGCMLSRIDGKSTVDYLPEPNRQDLVRSFCVDLLRSPAGRLDDVLERLRGELSRHALLR